MYLPKALRIVDIIISTLVGLYFLGIVIALPLDAINFLNEPDDYVRAHHLDTTLEIWQFYYLRYSILLFTMGLMTLITILLSLRYPHHRVLRISRLILVYGFVIVIPIVFYKWYLNGFNH